MPCVAPTNSCRTRRSTSARLSEQGRKRFAQHQQPEKHHQGIPREEVTSMLFLIVLSLLLLAVAIFALENAQAVTVRFLYWQLESSVAVVTLAATAAGALVAGLFGVGGCLPRWAGRR